MGAAHFRHRSWLVALVGILVFGLVLPLLPVALASAAADTLPEAVTDAVAASGLVAPNGLRVTPALEQGKWSFGTAVLIGTEQGDGPPEVVFYIARQQGGGWNAAIEADQTAFSKMVRQAPAGFVPDVFQPVATGIGAQDWKTKADLELAMPFAPGETWTLLSGTHGEPNDRPWAAIDIAPTGTGAGGAVRPAYAGFATTPCQDNESTDGGPLVVVRHMNGWETRYFHLDNTVHLSQNVGFTTVLGTTSSRTTGPGCSGSADGPHVHFTLHRRVDGILRRIDLNGVMLGGWEVRDGAESRDGCLSAKRIYYSTEGGVYQEACPGDSFYNNGELGGGAYIRAGKMVKGKTGELRFGLFPGRAQVKITLEYRRKGSSTLVIKDVKTITMNGAGGHRVVKFKVPKDVNGSMAIVATRVPSAGPGDRMYAVRVSVRKD